MTQKMFVFTHRYGSKEGYSFFFFSSETQFNGRADRGAAGGSRVKRSDCGPTGVGAGVSRRYPKEDITGKPNLTAGLRSFCSIR